jgi:transcriptional regulator with XRE-family HTH domain
MIRAMSMKIHDRRERQGLTVAHTARALGLHPETVSKWLKCRRYGPRRGVKRARRLDLFKALIVRWLDSHPYSAQQIFQRVREHRLPQLPAFPMNGIVARGRAAKSAGVQAASCPAPARLQMRCRRRRVRFGAQNGVGGCEGQGVAVEALLMPLSDVLNGVTGEGNDGVSRPLGGWLGGRGRDRRPASQRLEDAPDYPRTVNEGDPAQPAFGSGAFERIGFTEVTIFDSRH